MEQVATNDLKHPEAVHVTKHEKHYKHLSELSQVSGSTAFTTDTTLGDIEKQCYEPRKTWYTLLRYTLLNTYRRLFGIVFVGNAIAFVVTLCSLERDALLLPLVNGAAVNLAICGLARHPYVVNSIFKIPCQIPRTAPLRLRIMAAKAFHYGGVHSGCGIASFLWYIGFVGLYTYEYEPSPASTAVLALAWMVLVLLLLMIAAAYPAIRMRMHDYFEWTHRGAAWAVIVLFWALLMVFASQQTPSIGVFLIHQPVFWILIILTIAVVHPWTLLRKVKVTAEPLSTHAIRLHFDHTNPQFGAGLQVAKNPLKDWHSFAAFPDRYDTPDHKFSLVISKAGDWTTDTINNPPTHLWKRGVPGIGFGFVMKVFRRVVVVTTGSGIGPCLAYLGLNARPAMRILWQTRTPERTYGQRVIDLVKNIDPDPRILDTSKEGRKPMQPIVVDLFREFDAEAVCVISNPKLTKELVFGLESVGIPAFGPIFDS